MERLDGRCCLTPYRRDARDNIDGIEYPLELELS